MMKIVYGLISFFLVLSLHGCGGEADVGDLKSTVGMSKDEVESRYGKPQTSVLEATDDHPGGYWLYKVKSGAICKLRFDLPPRVIGADC